MSCHYSKIKILKEYLKAELSRISSMNKAREIVEKLNKKNIHEFPNFPFNENELYDLMKNNGEEEYVEDLNPSQIDEIAHSLAIARDNGVYCKINKHEDWKMISVSVEDLLISYAEQDLHELWREHNFNLVDVAKDDRVMKCHKDTEREPIKYRTLFALKENGKYKIFDGIHRAIQMVRNDCQRIGIYCPSENQ